MAKRLPVAEVAVEADLVVQPVQQPVHFDRRRQQIEPVLDDDAHAAAFRLSGQPVEMMGGAGKIFFRRLLLRLSNDAHPLRPEGCGDVNPLLHPFDVAFGRLRMARVAIFDEQRLEQHVRGRHCVTQFAYIGGIEAR